MDEPLVCRGWSRPLRLGCGARQRKVARLIVDFRRPVRSAILKVYVGEMGDLEHTIVANSITLTPGTITVDFSPDRQYMYVHVLDADDVEVARRELLSHLETHFGEGLHWWKSP